MKRRDFLKGAVAAAGAAGFPTLLPSLVFGRNKPNDKIQIGQIGCGRIARTHDLPETIRHDFCRIVAAADVDSKRLEDGKRWIENYYAKKTGQGSYVQVKTYGNYQDLLADPAIDAVIISTPDHWHAQIAIEAALAGKDIYLQKPASMTIVEGRQMSDVIHRTGRILQVGSQQRSMKPWPHFKRACELVRNGFVGDLQRVLIGLPTDPGCGEEPEMPIPPNLNYDMWLGSTPYVYYTEKRVHPQNSYDRPGWLRCDAYCCGMITGWGAHHVDTANWGMDTEYTGPIEVEGRAEYPKSGLWDVHGEFDVYAKYANGVSMHISSRHPNGVRFEGTEGWIFVTRGPEQVTASDPTSGGPSSPLQAGDPKILQAAIPAEGVHLYESPEQHLNWLECIRSRRQPVAPVEVSHRSCSACLVSYIAMKLGRKLTWNPRKEVFVGDDQANGMLSRPQRKPYGTNYVLL